MGDRDKGYWWSWVVAKWQEDEEREGEENQEKIRKASSAKGVMLMLYQTRKADPTADYDFRPIIMKRWLTGSANSRYGWSKIVVDSRVGLPSR